MVEDKPKRSRFHEAPSRPHPFRGKMGRAHARFDSAAERITCCRDGRMLVELIGFFPAGSTWPNAKEEGASAQRRQQFNPYLAVQSIVYDLSKSIAMKWFPSFLLCV